MLHKRQNVLHPWCMSVKSMLHEWYIHVAWRCYIHVARVLHPCCMSVTSMLHECYIHVAWVLHPCGMSASSMWHECYIHVAWVLHPCCTSVTSCCMSVTSMLHECYIHDAWVLPGRCCRNVAVNIEPDMMHCYESVCYILVTWMSPYVYVQKDVFKIKTVTTKLHACYINGEVNFNIHVAWML